MAYQMKENSGTLFKENEKKNERGPDYTGDANIGGEVYRMAAWIRESESGRKFMSFKFTPKEERAAASAPQKRRQVDDDESIPF